MTEEPRFALLTLEEYQETLERLKRLEGLCVRAAEALTVFNEVYPQQNRSELIAELRKAAE
jgi:hypothetical protein